MQLGMACNRTVVVTQVFPLSEASTNLAKLQVVWQESRHSSAHNDTSIQEGQHLKGSESQQDEELPVNRYKPLTPPVDEMQNTVLSLLYYQLTQKDWCQMQLIRQCE